MITKQPPSLPKNQVIQGHNLSLEHKLFCFQIIAGNRL